MTETDSFRQRWGLFRGLSFEEKDLASVCASLACATLNLVCEHVVCSMEEIQFPLTCRFIPESVFPPLTSSPAQPLKKFWPVCTEKILFGIDIILKTCNSYDMNAIADVNFWQHRILPSPKNKSAQRGYLACVGGKQGMGGWIFGQRGDAEIQERQRVPVSLPSAPLAYNHGSLNSRCCCWGSMHHN